MNNNLSADEASQVQARKNSNLAFAFFCMSKDRARDMEVFYTYCRVLDDIADDPQTSAAEKIRLLNGWKDEIEKIYSGSGGGLSKLGSQLRDTVMRRDVPKKYMLDIIEGVMRDTDPAEFETFADIKKYCYGVASAVGLASIYIFGFKNPKTKEFAEALGYALQFTNILRDAIFDWKEMKRVYIPSCEMRAFGVSPGDFDSPRISENCRALFAMMYFRAKHFFNRARNLMQPEDAKALAPALIMGDIYEKILEKIRARNFEISEKVVKIPKIQKIWLALGAMRRAKKYSKIPPKNFGRAAVLGAGIAGMEAAVNLSLKGFEVDVFEAKAAAGGRISAIEPAGLGRLDNGGHAIMGCYENFLSFLDLIGARRGAFKKPCESMKFLNPDGTSFSYDFPSSRSRFSIFKLPKIEGFGVFSNLLMLAKIKLGLAKALEGETVAEYLSRQNISDEAKSLLWNPFCVSVQNTDPNLACADMFVKSISKSLLKGCRKSALVVNKIPLAEIVCKNAKAYIEACGGSVNLSSRAEAVEIENGAVKSFSVGGKKIGGYDFYVLAFGKKAAAAILPDCPLKAAALQIESSPILNAYFSTNKKLFEGDFVALANSQIHWVFDRTESAAQKYVYSLTISAFDGEFSPAEIKKSIWFELEKYFGKFEIIDFLPSLFRDATILSTCKNERLRPKSRGHFSNAIACGDWIDGGGLPCTIECASATAKISEF
ncbi:MAG: squalene/phytoene synthase family protein [Opitutales bacterium]|nr:squalene/phytoene synthase family protein [Opitutales bacterium]